MLVRRKEIIMKFIKFNDTLYAVLLCLLVLFSLIDGFASAVWINYHFASEANPIMAVLMDIDLSLFLYIKIGVTLLCSLLLWKIRHHRLAKIALVFTLAIYTYILYKHIAIAYEVICFYAAVDVITGS
jgi:hypothetical protein